MTKMCGALQLYISQSQQIRNHGYRTEAHRRRRENWAQQQSEEWIEHARGDRNANRVVDESKKQILPDVAHRRLAQFTCSQNSFKVSFKEGDATALHRNADGRAHRNT